MTLLDVLARSRVIVALPPADESNDTRTHRVVAEVVVQEGLRVLALPAAQANRVGDLAAALGGRAVVGVYGARTETDLQAAHAAGAAFATSPLSDPEVAIAARELRLAFFPGALTPNEVAAAWQFGVQGVLITPGDVFGVLYGHTLAATLPEVPTIASGVSAYAAQHWLAAGSLAIVPDSTLISDTLAGGDLGNLRERARSFATEVRAAAPWTPP